jgi:hypothetical protein
LFPVLTSRCRTISGQQGQPSDPIIDNEQYF